MFARYFVELPLRAEQVEAALTRRSSGWLPGLAEHASEHGRELLGEVGFGRDFRIARQVSIDLAAPIRTASKVLIPLRWTATDAHGLFPTMDADLEIAPLGPERAQLAMSARYTPPLGVLGRAADRAVLHRVAEATLKDFLDRIRDALLGEATTTPTDRTAHR